MGLGGGWGGGWDKRGGGGMEREREGDARRGAGGGGERKRVEEVREIEGGSPWMDSGRERESGEGRGMRAFFCLLFPSLHHRTLNCHWSLVTAA